VAFRFVSIPWQSDPASPGAAVVSGGQVKSDGTQLGDMRAKREYRNREDTQVAVLDALVERGGEGMTVLELRTRVDAEIDRIEDALGELKAEDLISVERDGGRVVIRPDERVIPQTPDDEAEPSLIERLRERLRL